MIRLCMRPAKMARSAGAVVGLLAIAAVSGCSVDDLKTEDRLVKGLVVILPGIEGRSIYNYNLARGLAEGGVKAGIEIHEWGTTVPGGLMVNLTDYERNMEQARALKDRVLEYQRAYPGRGVHLIGHSGGGGLAVMALEQMPRDARITSAILLAAAISPKHDLREALRHTQYGIFNYYSPLDVGFLGVGTSVFGTMDRSFTLAAGATPFERPTDLNSEDQKLYARLHQIRWTESMADSGHLGDHFGWTHRGFVRQYLAPLVRGMNTSHWSSAGAVAAADSRPR